MFRWTALFLLLLLAFAGPSSAVPGATDRVPAASLLVPFFEVGVDPATHSHNTFIAVNNRAGGPARIHYHVWDIDGRPTPLNGNVLIPRFGTWSATLRDLVAGASAGVRTQLRQSDYYRGFMTIDLVTANTGLAPTQGDFPFGNANQLEGYIYYTVLPLGVTGLSMVPIEAIPTAPAGHAIVGFYSHPLERDNREDLGPFNRGCTMRRSALQSCAGVDFILNRMDFRLFGSPSAASRVVVFAWDPVRPFGPSVHCDVSPGECDGSMFRLQRYAESGALRELRPFRLDHVVNVTDAVVTEPGWLSLQNIPSVNVNTNFYGFSINQGLPGWMATFEAFIDP